ncbi:SCO0930 family lipoprotein [Streptomyces sp. NPDC004647]|uniref:SCO0930 family lipoprotein n=1 Tax=Streptomyces sp. NPDC004647 TaxID=3154671 RepID=UPI0033A88B4C
MRKWQSASIAVTAAAIMLTTACGAEKSASQSAAAQPAGQADAAYGDKGGYGGAAPQGGGQGKPKSPGQLTISDDKKLGPVLTDSEGFTLYRFDKDTPEPPTSSCDGDCATTWPPVPAADVSSTAGIDASLLGEVTRADGTQQLTVGGWPMYRYSKDKKAWQVKGEGVGGTWFASAPDGKKASADGAAEEGAEAGSGAGSGADPGADPGAGPGAGGGDSGSAGAGQLPALSAVDNPELGEIIRDGKGRTLYRFDKDSAWPMKTNCTGPCLDTWKPVKPVDKSGVEGIDPKLLTNFTRPDGTEQLSIDCVLLYTYTGDEKPGDTNGQGVGGAWFAVSPEGKKVGDTEG